MWIALIDQSFLLYHDPNTTTPQYTFSLVEAMVCHSTDAPGFSSTSQIKEELSITVEIDGASNSGLNDGEIITLCLSNKDEKVNKIVNNIFTLIVH